VVVRMPPPPREGCSSRITCSAPSSVHGRPFHQAREAGRVVVKRVVQCRRGGTLPSPRSRGRCLGRCLRSKARQLGDARSAVRGQRNGFRAVRSGRRYTFEGLAPLDRTKLTPPAARGVRAAVIGLLKARSPPRRKSRWHRSMVGSGAMPPSPALHLQLAACGRELALRTPMRPPPGFGKHSQPKQACTPSMAAIGQHHRRLLWRFPRCGPETTAAPGLELSGKGSQQPGHPKPHRWCVGHAAGVPSDPAGRRQRPGTRALFHRLEQGHPYPRARPQRPPHGAQLGHPRRSGPHPHAPIQPSIRNSPATRAAVLISEPRLRLRWDMEMGGRQNPIRSAGPCSQGPASRPKALEGISPAAGGPPRSLQAEDSGGRQQDVGSGTSSARPGSENLSRAAHGFTEASGEYAVYTILDWRTRGVEA